MTRKKPGMSRRDFLWATAAASAGAISAEQLSAASPLLPHKMLTVGTDTLQAEFDTVTGLPVAYRLLKHGVGLSGDAAAIDLRVCKREPWKVGKALAQVAAVRPEHAGVVFEMVATVNEERASQFQLKYSFAGNRMTVELEDVKEQEGFELLEVRLPALVTVRREQSKGWMAHGDTGGALIELATAKPGSLAPNQFWGDTLSTLPVLMAGDARAFCVLLNVSCMDGGALTVAADGHGAMGTVQRHRVDGSICADLNLGKDQPLNCGNAGTPNLLVGQKPVCHLDFFAIGTDWKQAWLQGAHHVRKQLPPKRTTMYDDVYTYGIRLDEPSWPTPATTFAQCEEIIREVAALTGSTPQIVHLWGWQFKGKDTGYPAVNEVDARIGGYDGMMRLMEDAKKYNARVTLSDNYDDGYRSSPAWNEAIVARRPDGELYNSRSWTGEISYILGLAKYVQHGALERVAYTTGRYRLPGTTHIDVLTYYAIRNDWDRDHPASGYKNLVEGKFAVLDAFHKLGVDVSSEAPRFPFMGKVSFYWQGCGIRPCPMGGRVIPMFPAVYRQTAVWGDGMRRGESKPGALQMFYGGGPRFMTRYDEDRIDVAETFYLQNVPWMLLHRRNILSYDAGGESSRIGIEGGEIRVSLESGRYSVTIDGGEVATEDWVSCPLGTDRIAFYSRTPRTFRLRLPAGWDPQKIKAEAGFRDGMKPAAFEVTSGIVSVDVAGRRGVILTRI